jgi:hypothetical protein
MNANSVGAAGYPTLLEGVPQVAAIWFPPYGNPGASSQGTGAPKAEPSSYAQAMQEHEDKVLELIGNLGPAERAIAYKYLYASGMRIASADEDLRKAIHKEIGHK